MKKFNIRAVGISACTLALASTAAYADRNLDNFKIHTGELSKNAAIHVHAFSTSGADLGNPKFRDTARTMAKSAPHLLAADIVEALRRAGFTAVTLDESEGEPSGEALNLTGSFTKLNPGSQNLRLWIGLGAGESQVCISGELTNSSGSKLADFWDCRNGLGWGASAPQGDKGAKVLGEHVAGGLIDWAERPAN